ncbi:MAG: hypothetical protein IJZ61_04430 [Oscillospiraceae bacterium]|nr:hypothetical protein [Oscillospiraceae bacterium]
MDNKYFDEFVVYKGSTYRAKSYTNDYELFDTDDIAKITPLMRIPKGDKDDYYFQSAACDINGIRYSVVDFKDGICYYKRYISSEIILEKSVDEVNEIWLRRNHSQKGIVIETLWLNPNCSEKPSCNKYYVEEMAREGSVMVSYAETERFNYDTTLELLKEIFDKRMIIICKYIDFLDGTPCCELKIDEEKFDLTTDIYDILCISPKNKLGNKYIYIIVEALNKAENSP